MPRKNLKKPYFLIAIFLVASPAIIFGFSTLYFYSQLQLYISFNDNLNYNNYIGEFKEPDYAFLELRAAQMEERIQKYHTPNGSVLSVKFTDKELTEVKYYGGKGDSTIWTGCYIAGEAFRWAVADRTNSLEDRTKSEIAIMRALNHFEDCLQVTGIRGALARYACPWSEENAELNLCGYDDSEVEGGEYDGWTYHTYVSRDQLNGLSFGYGLIYDLVKNSTIKEKIAKHVEWIVDYFERNRWQSIMEDGTQSFRLAPMEPMLYRTPSGSNHLLAWLNLARRINYDKYNPIYQRWAIDKNLAFMTDEPVDYNVLFAYYTINVITLAMYGLINLEPNLELKEMYTDSYIRSIYDVVRYHRNAFQNFIYMNVTGMNRFDIEANMILKDSLDALQRFAETKYPNRNNGVYNTWWDDFEDIVDPISITVNKRMSRPIMMMNPLSAHTEFKIHSKYALPINRRGSGSFIWQDSPFELNYDGDKESKYCFPGNDYTLVYWMGRYYYYIPDGEGNYT
ncbi:MAG: hypothetical protein GF364_14215 [Candidatus Lokiarchaeota archaeon]|nr:hypothetical protein [Candidatus Lokiarchaeota archaeon]